MGSWECLDTSGHIWHCLGNKAYHATIQPSKQPSKQSSKQLATKKPTNTNQLMLKSNQPTNQPSIQATKQPSHNATMEQSLHNNHRVSKQATTNPNKLTNQPSKQASKQATYHMPFTKQPKQSSIQATKPTSNQPNNQPTNNTCTYMLSPLTYNWKTKQHVCVWMCVCLQHWTHPSNVVLEISPQHCEPQLCILIWSQKHCKCKLNKACTIHTHERKTN